MTGEQHRQCSCTDCLQNIELDQISSQHSHAKGSRVGKLYSGDAKTHHREMDDGDKKHKHSQIRTIADSKDQFNECQSCCSCSSKMQPNRNADMINNHQAKPVNKIQTSSSSRLYTKRKQGDRSRRMRAVHFKTKYIRSDPCTCTTNLSEVVNKRHSRLHSRKFTKGDESIPTTIESKAIKAKRCVCECNIIRKPNKSLQRLKSAKEKVKNSIRSSISKIENSFRIKKDSIMMFRDKLMKKRAMKKYECEPYYCIPEYSPPKCYERIKMRLDDIKSDIKKSYHDLRLITSGISFKTRPKKEKSVSKRKSKSKPVTCTCEPETEPTPNAVPVVEHFENKDKIHEKSFLSKKRKDSPSVKRNGLVVHIEPTVLSKKKLTKPKSPLNIVCDCEKDEKQHETSILSKKSFTKTFEYGRYTLPHLDRAFPKECEASMCIPGECDFRKSAEILPPCNCSQDSQDISEYSSTQFSQQGVGDKIATKSKHSQSLDMKKHHAKSENIEPKKQAVRISSNFSFNIEFYKEQKNIKEAGETTRNRVRKHTPRDEKSVSNKTKYSSPRKVCNKNKSVQSKIKRLSSVKTNHALKRCFCTVQLKDAQKLQNSSHCLKDKQIKPTTISECCDFEHKETQTKKHNQLDGLPTLSLPPPTFKCDSYFDLDENCDSSSCEKRVRDRLKENRNKRPRAEKKSRKCSIGTTSPHRMTKTCASSQCSKLSSKSTDQHSDIKNSHFKPPLLKQHQKERIEYGSKIENASNRSVVRIGSSFSFNVEFYKENEPFVDVKSDKKLEHGDNKSKQKLREICINKRKSRNKSTQSKLKSIDRFHSKTNQDSSTCCDAKIDSNRKQSTKKVSANVCKYMSSITTQTREPVAYVTPPLLPPLSTPVKCDDFTCKHNIKQRCHANRYKNKIKNTVGSSTSRTKTIKTLSDTGSSKRQKSYLTKTKSLSSKNVAPYGQDISSYRQAVSVGSSFSFNIGFYKDTNSENQVIKAVNKGENKNYDLKNKCKERICKANDIPSLHQRATIRLNKSGIKPFLDKCFCTLKLLKGRKDTIRVSSPKVQSKVNTKDTKSQNCQCNINRSTNQSIHKTKQMCTAKVVCKSTSSGTSKSYIKNHKLQAQKTNKPESISEKRISRNIDSSANINEKSESKKQVVRIGSSFSFNVEFYKEKADAPDFNEMQPVVQQTNKIRHKKHEDRKIPLHLQKHKYCKQTSNQLTNDEAKVHDMLRCSERCTSKRNKIDRCETNRPKTRNISVITQESKKSYIKHPLGTCRRNKGIEARQKSCKHVARKISYTASGPEKMKSEIIGTDTKPVKCKTQKTQSIFQKPCLKNKDIKQPKLTMKSPTKQLVRINSNFSFNIEFNKEHSKPLVKKQKPKFNYLNDMNKSETKRNNLKDRQSMTVSKNGKSSNLGLMLKHRLCSLKYPKHTKNGKNRNDNEKETQLNIPIQYKCQRYMCEKCFMTNRKQPKAKSVSDVKGPCLKTKKVQSSFREHEPCTNKYSDHNIKREKPRLKHRLQKSTSKKAVRLGSGFKFDIEFYKKYESPDQDNKCTNIKKLRRDPKDLHLYCGPKDELSTKKINDKRLYGSYFHKHREYQVGYLKEEVTGMQGSVFQQQYQIWHMRVSDENVEKTIQIVNPVLVQSKPFSRKYTKSNLRGKGKKKLKWRKKHVRFAISNIETIPKNNYSFFPSNKNKRFRSEIYNSTCFCDSSEVLPPKRTMLRTEKKIKASVSKNLTKNSSSRTFSSFIKMPKESLNLQSKEKTSKFIEITQSKKKMTPRKIFKNFRSNHKKQPTKLKTTQTEHKTSSCKCNIDILKKRHKGPDDNVSHCSNLLSKKKTRFGSRKPNKTNIKESKEKSKHKNQTQPKRGNHHKRRKIASKHQGIQVFQIRNVKKQNSTINTIDDLNKHIEKSFSKGQVLKNNESKRQSTNSEAKNAKIKEKSKIIKSIVKFTLLPKTRHFNGNSITYIGDRNSDHNKSHIKANTTKCDNKNCRTIPVETIMSFSKRNFRKKRSRTCMSKECKLLIKTTAKKYNKKTTLYKLSQRLHTISSVCNDICLKRAKTNLLENTLKTNTTEIKKRSKIIKSIMKFTLLPNTRHFDGNSITYIADRNPGNNNSYLKADTVECYNETCKVVRMEIIMPYSKRNFRKTRSRICLSKECKLLIKTPAKKYNNAIKNVITRTILNTKTSGCNDICLKQAKTNLLDNTPSRHVKKASHVPTKKNKSVNTLINASERKNSCCVCSRRYSDTDTDKFQPKALVTSYVSIKINKVTTQPITHGTSYASKEINKDTGQSKKHDISYISKDSNKLTDKPRQRNHENNISKVRSFKNKILHFCKINVKSCECENKNWKNKSKLRSSMTPNKKSKRISLCRHECKCSASLNKAKETKKKKKLKEKLTKQNNKKIQQLQRKKQISNRKSKMIDKETSKLLKMYSETSDSKLLAESCLDVTKMSAGLIWNLMKVPYHVITDPKRSCEKFKMGMRNPANKAISIQQKIGAMRVTKNAKVMLESFTITNFLIHAFDDDAKRLQVIKSKRRMKKRESDFGCSPYMASLRKRPFLWVYNKCPAFYPQFISLLTGWRQFIDMLLFLFAIVVWSPCIFSIELCRAIICCCLCTG